MLVACCRFLDTASISDAAAKEHDGQCATSTPEPHPMAGHKFELRVVVYRDGDMLRAYPSIAKVQGSSATPFVSHETLKFNVIMCPDLLINPPPSHTRVSA
jgi:hypothetical protein